MASSADAQPRGPRRWCTGTRAIGCAPIRWYSSGRVWGRHWRTRASCPGPGSTTTAPPLLGDGDQMCMRGLPHTRHRRHGGGRHLYGPASSFQVRRLAGRGCAVKVTVVGMLHPTQSLGSARRRLGWEEGCGERRQGGAPTGTIDGPVWVDERGAEEFGGGRRGIFIPVFFPVLVIVIQDVLEDFVLQRTTADRRRRAGGVQRYCTVVF